MSQESRLRSQESKTRKKFQDRRIQIPGSFLFVLPQPRESLGIVGNLGFQIPNSSGIPDSQFLGESISSGPSSGVFPREFSQYPGSYDFQFPNPEPRDLESRHELNLKFEILGFGNSRNKSIQKFKSSTHVTSTVRSATSETKLKKRT